VNLSQKNLPYLELYRAENFLDRSKLNWADLQRRESQLLTDELVKQGILKESQFIFYSEGGAMGEGGNIMTVQKDGEVYKGNYAYGRLSISLIIEAFPWIGSKKFDEIVDSGISKEGKVHYYYLGCGNHLFVKDDIDEAFHVAIEKRKDCELVENAPWYDIACIVCPDKHRQEMLQMVRIFCEDTGMKYPEGYPDTITDQELYEWIEGWSDFDPLPELK
jgi:hypothetical protein